jgi:diguanylate cyclase (GGDEF)-like protein
LTTAAVGPAATRAPHRFAPEGERQFRETRAASLAAVNANTFWSIAVIVLMFGAWDYFVDRGHWLAAFRVRAIGSAAIVATGIFQKLPGNLRWMPLMAKVRLIIAVVASMIAALLLDRGYGFGVAGLVAIILTGPYIAIDRRDLLITNAIVLAAVTAVLLAGAPESFDAIGTIVFVLLAIVVSALLGRALEVSNRRAFALDLELHRDARTDLLTGLQNRRSMEERGPLELKRANRLGTPISLVLCDLDHFKSINDRLGHDAGDLALRTVARVLRGALRETDVLGRWGGEEFMAVLVDTDARAAKEVAERMRKAVNAATFAGLPEGATISAGVSTVEKVTAPAAAWDSLVKEADQLLYQAKKEGRNRVIYPQA